jgi:tetratricopeptide (TPR) repeat protein
MSEAVFLKPLRENSRNPTTQDYLLVVDIMRAHPDPSTLDDKVSTLDLKNMTKTVNKYVVDSPTGNREYDPDILQISHDYCKAGIGRIENGRIFLECPNIDVSSVQKMLPHFWSHAAEFSYKLWINNHKPTNLEDALAESDQALRVSFEDDIPGKLSLLNMRSLIMKALFKKTGNIDYSVSRISTNLELLGLSRPGRERADQELRLLTAKEALSLAEKDHKPLKHAQIAYDIFAEEVQSDRDYGSSLLRTLDIICRVCPVEESEKFQLVKLAQLKNYMRSLIETDRERATNLIPTLKGVTLDLSDAGHDVAYESGMFLYELSRPTDSKYPNAMSDVTGYLFKSAKTASNEDERIRRLEKTIEVCKDVTPQIESNHLGFIEFTCAKAYLDLGDIKQKQKHRAKAIEMFQKAKRTLTNYSSVDTEATLEFIERVVGKLTKKKKERRKGRSKPKHHPKHQKYTRQSKRQLRIDNDEDEY